MRPPSLCRLILAGFLILLLLSVAELTPQSDGTPPQGAEPKQSDEPPVGRISPISPVIQFPRPRPSFPSLALAA